MFNDSQVTSRLKQPLGRLLLRSKQSLQDRVSEARLYLRLLDSIEQSLQHSLDARFATLAQAMEHPWIRYVGKPFSLAVQVGHLSALCPQNVFVRLPVEECRGVWLTFDTG